MQYNLRVQPIWRNVSFENVCDALDYNCGFVYLYACRNSTWCYNHYIAGMSRYTQAKLSDQEWLNVSLAFNLCNCNIDAGSMVFLTSDLVYQQKPTTAFKNTLAEQFITLLAQFLILGFIIKSHQINSLPINPERLARRYGNSIGWYSALLGQRICQGMNQWGPVLESAFCNLGQKSKNYNGRFPLRCWTKLYDCINVCKKKRLK